MEDSARVARVAQPGEILRPKKKLFRYLSAYLFSLPYIILMLAFGVGPAIYALIISFTSYKAGQPQYFGAGLSNYSKAVSDFRFGSAVGNIAQFLIISIPLGIVGVIVIALLLHARQGWYTDFLRTLYFVPGAVAGPTAILLAIFMFDPRLSPFAPLLKSMGFQTVSDVAKAQNLPVMITLIGFFGGAGGWIAIFYGALQSVSKELLEAALIDGCSALQSAIRIKLPMIYRYIIFMFILTFAGNIQLFAEPLILNNIVAGNTIAGPTYSPNMLSYFLAFSEGNFGTAAVISLLMVSVGLLGAFIIIYGTKFYETDATSAS
jgi:multiple sugar transport system permease protein